MWLFKPGVSLVVILCIKQASSLISVLVDGNRLRLNCPVGFNIYIESARWVFQNGLGLADYGNNYAQIRAYNQLALDQTADISKLCTNKNSCSKQHQSSRVPLPSNLQFHIRYGCYLGTCPHGAFIVKHLAKTIVEAATYAAEAENERKKRKWSQTNKTTIFINARQNMRYLRDENDKLKCYFERPIEKYRCDKKDGVWDCVVGRTERAFHLTTTGHYEDPENEKRSQAV